MLFSPINKALELKQWNVNIFQTSLSSCALTCYCSRCIILSHALFTWEIQVSNSMEKCLCKFLCLMVQLYLIITLRCHRMLQPHVPHKHLTNLSNTVSKTVNSTVEDYFFNFFFYSEWLFQNLKFRIKVTVVYSLR